MIRWLYVAFRLFAGQTTSRGWGCLILSAVIGFGGCLALCLTLFTPEIFTLPYSLEEIGAACLAVAGMGLLFLALLAIASGGVGLRNFVTDVNDHITWLDDEQRLYPHSPTAGKSGKQG